MHGNEASESPPRLAPCMAVSLTATPQRLRLRARETRHVQLLNRSSASNMHQGCSPKIGWKGQSKVRGGQQFLAARIFLGWKEYFWWALL